MKVVMTQAGDDAMTEQELRKVREREEDMLEAFTIEHNPYLRYAACRLLQSHGDVYKTWHAFMQHFEIRNPRSASEVWDEIYNESRLAE